MPADSSVSISSSILGTLLAPVDNPLGPGTFCAFAFIGVQSKDVDDNGIIDDADGPAESSGAAGGAVSINKLRAGSEMAKLLGTGWLIRNLNDPKLKLSLYGTVPPLTTFPATSPSAFTGKLMNL